MEPLEDNRDENWVGDAIPVDALHHQANSPTTIKISSIIATLRDLSTSLSALLEQPPNAESVSYNILCQFRAEVAFQIIKYSQEIKEFRYLVEMLTCPNIQNEVKVEYKEHLENLNKYMNNLGIWWSKSEHLFHLKKMRCFISHVGMTGTTTESHEEAKLFYSCLLDTKRLFEDELQKMTSTTQILEDSSNVLGVANQIYYGAPIFLYTRLFL